MTKRQILSAFTTVCAAALIGFYVYFMASNIARNYQAATNDVQTAQTTAERGVKP